MEEKRLKGRLTISRIGALKNDYIRMALEDESSGIEFLAVNISLENFCRAVTRAGSLPCEYTLAGVELIGKTIETKTEYVPFSWDEATKDFDKWFQKAVKPYQVDGWLASYRESRVNTHKITDKGYEVLFTRLVGEGVGYTKE